MSNTFEENLGKNTYVTLNQVKDYLSISGSTADSRLSNLINYATGVIEHYIGQEVVANTYTEVFNGGSYSLFVNRLPVIEVYQVTEFDGQTNTVLKDPMVDGLNIPQQTSFVSFSAVGTPSFSTKVKKFGLSSLKLDANSYLISTETVDLADSDFTIEMFVRNDANTLQNSTIFSTYTDANNYLKLNLANQYGLSCEISVDGTLTTITGANTSIESQEYEKRKWAHVAFSCNTESERAYLSYNGTIIGNTSYSNYEHSFSTNVLIGESFTGYVDECRVSYKSLYETAFTPTTNRFRPTSTSGLLLHFDNDYTDALAINNNFTFDRSTGEITKNIYGMSLGINANETFSKYKNSITVDYKAGFEVGSIPYDLQLVTMDYIKLLYKQMQDKKTASLNGESTDTYPLSSGFPPHIRKVLDMYRVI